MKIAIVFPCYNVERTVRQVLHSFSDEALNKIDEIVAINNCSTDNTLKILHEIKSENQQVGKKMTIIENSENFGYGGSQKIGYSYCIDKGKTHLIVMHSDGQTDANLLVLKFIQELENDPELDLIITNRFSKDSNILGYSRLRTYGNYLFNFLTFMITGLRMEDAGTGIMLVKVNVLKSLPYQYLTDSWQFHPQLNILFFSSGALRIKTVPMNWKDADTGSRLNLFKYGMQLLAILIKYRMNRSILGKTSADCFIEDQGQREYSFKVF